MLLMPLMVGCNKNADNKSYEELIIGEWYQYYYEDSYEDYNNPEYNDFYSVSFTKETTENYYLFEADGTYTDDYTFGVSTGTWSINNGAITFEEDGETETFTIEFENDNTFYISDKYMMDYGDGRKGIVTTKEGWKRL